MLAQKNRTEQFGKALVASAAEVRLAGLGLEEPPLGLLDHLKYRRPAGAVAENADANIDLLGARIGLCQGDQSQERIALHGRQIGKSPRLRVGSVQHGTAIS